MNEFEVVWLSMMFALIKERFFDNKPPMLQDLSATGAAVEQSVVKNLPVKVSAKKKVVVTFKALTIDDVTGDAPGLKQFEELSTGEHAWMEARYKKKVDAGVLNLFADSETRLMIADKGKIVPFDEEKIRRSSLFGSGRAPVELQSFDRNMVGTPEKIEADRIWAARYNVAALINDLARREFEKRHGEVVDAFSALVTKNMNRLLDAIGAGEFIAPTEMKNRSDGFVVEKHRIIKPANILDIVEYKGRGATLWLSKNNKLCFYTSKIEIRRRVYYRDREIEHIKCYVNGSHPMYVAVFTPNTPQALAALCGIEVSELPDVLQHWYSNELYHGNSILNRCDPMDWVVENPWRKEFKPQVAVVLSKSGLKKLQRKMAGSKPSEYRDVRTRLW